MPEPGVRISPPSSDADDDLNGSVALLPGGRSARVQASALAGRDEDMRHRLTTLFRVLRERVVDGHAVVGAVRRERTHTAIELLEQPGHEPAVVRPARRQLNRSDVASACIHSNVQLCLLYTSPSPRD